MRYTYIWTIALAILLAACTQTGQPAYTAPSGNTGETTDTGMTDSGMAGSTGTADTTPSASTPIRNVDMFRKGNMSGSHEIVVEEVNYGPSTGYLARPKENGTYPGVVMIHEWWGLNDNIREMARLLASHGYVVLAVDMYGESTTDPERARELAGDVRNNREAAIANLKGAVAYLKTIDSVYDNKIASLGWCFGGQWSLQLALNEKLAATVIYYGQLETDFNKLAKVRWPVLGIFGANDTSIPVKTVKEFETALDEVGVRNEIYIYPGVGHAFANPSGMNYAPTETKDAWEKTIRFLDRYLK